MLSSALEHIKMGNVKALAFPDESEFQLQRPALHRELHREHQGLCVLRSIVHMALPSRCIILILVLLLFAFLFIFILLFWPRHMACSISVPRPGIEQRPWQ